MACERSNRPKNWILSSAKCPWSKAKIHAQTRPDPIVPPNWLLTSIVPIHLLDDTMSDTTRPHVRLSPLSTLMMILLTVPFVPIPIGTFAIQRHQETPMLCDNIHFNRLTTLADGGG
jgi:hypothetical protein